MHTHSIRRMLTLFCLGILSFAVATSAARANESDEQQALSIQTAQWKAKRDQLIVRGKGEAGQQVILTDADSLAVIAGVPVSSKGKWKLKLTGLSPAPCRVSATLGPISKTKDVDHAPEGCGPNGSLTGDDSGGGQSGDGQQGGSGGDDGQQAGSGDVSQGGSGGDDGQQAGSGDDSQDDNQQPSWELEIDSAKWSGRRSRLSVKGKALTGVRVAVSDAATGTVLGSATGNKKGLWKVTVADPESVPCSVQASADGQNDSKAVANAPADCSAGGGGGDNGGGGTPPPLAGDFQVLAANDLGMHCADKDYQIFSILPPFNVVHAQVIQRGTLASSPRILTDADVDVVYAATSNPLDPVGAGSINTTSQNRDGVFKTNFWGPASASETNGGKSYATLFPSVAGAGMPELCVDPLTPAGCPSVLSLFEPIPGDLGLPVPDPAQLPSLAVDQQAMPSVTSHVPLVTAPYVANDPQPFGRFDRDLPFFVSLPIGYLVSDANWFAADGIPMLPVDDNGVENAYPVMRVSAVAKGADPKQAGNHLAGTDVVLPVASEADCQGCHADPGDFGNGAATVFAAVTGYADGTPWEVMTVASAPGPEPLLNAAKINVLRLHDAKHGADYTSSVDGSSTPCTSGGEGTCLDQRRFVQCSQCHYSPALDLAQTGPVDEPEQGVNGRQQTRHISMSRAMHGHHGGFTDLFPVMPAPDDPARTPQYQAQVLEETCYQCHPGKRTQCLRGAMANGGVVCQDCHGNMAQVGNDFSGGLPGGAGPDLSLRVPWANEPQCQSCHIGDALTMAATDISDLVVADDGIRLLQTFTRSDRDQPDLPHIAAPNSRFAENEGLYRLSKGHGGVMCEGCHGSTHAIWPVQPDGEPGDAFLANDNLAAIGLQGHSGTITECDTCHAPGSLGLTLNGPHGMHPVNDRRWSADHEHVAEDNKNACRTCHGVQGEGTVLSRTAADRTLARDDDGNGTVFLPKGTPVRCDHCHSNELD